MPPKNFMAQTYEDKWNNLKMSEFEMGKLAVLIGKYFLACEPRTI